MRNNDLSKISYINIPWILQIKMTPAFFFFNVEGMVVGAGRGDSHGSHKQTI